MNSRSSGSFELALEQLRRAADAAQRILDLVREVADQLAVGLLLLEDLGLARDLQLLLELAQLEDEARVAGLHRGDHAMQVHAFAAHVELEIVLVEARVAFERLVKALHESGLPGGPWRRRCR